MSETSPYSPSAPKLIYWINILLMASTLLRHVVVIGASGNVGSAIMSSLQAEKDFTITVITRLGSETRSKLSQTVNCIGLDYTNKSELVKAFQGQDALVICLGAPYIGLQSLIVDAAAEAGIKRILPSEFGTEPTTQEISIVPMLIGKVTIVDHIRSHPGLSWTGIVTGALFDWHLSQNGFGINVKDRMVPVFDNDPDHCVRVTTLQKVGEAVAAVLKNPTIAQNRYALISSFMVSSSDLIATMESITKDSYSLFPAISTFELEQTGKEKLATGDRSGVPLLTRAGLWRKGAQSGATEDNKLLGLHQETLSEVIAKHLAL